MNRNSLNDQSNSPKYAARVPESIFTPDVVETSRLGRLEFFDGMPSGETVRKVYDQLDFSRGVETFLTGCPAASIYAFVQGMKETGMATFSMGITEQLLDARSLWLTPNTTTVYCIAEINVEHGPTVLEVPPGVLGPVDDAFFRWVTDVGFTGPDRGQGGKYLFLPPGYQGEGPSRCIADGGGLGEDLFHPLVGSEGLALLDPDRGPQSNQLGVERIGRLVLYHGV
jgi:hypothetical protein